MQFERECPNSDVPREWPSSVCSASFGIYAIDWTHQRMMVMGNGEDVSCLSGMRLWVGGKGLQRSKLQELGEDWC